MAVTGFDAHDPPAPELIADCVHCGFCLPACPTYALWGEEMDSPRGRILLMDAVNRGEAELSETVVRHWDGCLGCMACEPACPSGVRYGRLIEQTRQQVERRHRRALPSRLQRAALFALLPHQQRLRPLAWLLAAYNQTGVRGALRRMHVLDLLPPRTQTMEALAPRLTSSGLRERAPEHVRVADPRLRVAVLRGCVQRAFFPDVSAASARVLAAWGCEVLAPLDQGCCGALEEHAGRQQSALRRARRLIASLERIPADRIAVDSAGCGSFMKEYATLLAGDPEWSARAERVASKVRDVTEILAELGAPRRTLHPLPLRVAYHDACHLAHAQGVRSQPRELLASIPGLELLPLEESDMCCGSAGVYNLVQAHAAAELGRRKAERVQACAADCVVAGNSGCLLQIAGHLGLQRSNVGALHTIQVLDASLRGLPRGDVLASAAGRTAM
jgi:glycolate oxidase iron-sulfur subunit